MLFASGAFPSKESNLAFLTFILQSRGEKIEGKSGESILFSLVSFADGVSDTPIVLFSLIINKIQLKQ